MAAANLDGFLEALGRIDPSRVMIRPAAGEATEADLIRVNDRKRSIYELVDGTLVQKATSFAGSLLAAALIAILRAHVVPRNLGLVSAPDGMLRLAPGLVRAPDVAFIAWGRIPGGRIGDDPIAGFAPDLAIEILSPSNTRAEMARRRREYFAAGVRLVWEVDPVARTVAVHEGPGHPTVLDASMTLDGGPVLPGFALPLGELFGELDRTPA